MAIRPLAAARRTAPSPAFLRAAVPALLLLALCAAHAHAAAPRVSVSLISAAASIEPGVPLRVGLRQRIAPGWHTYWLTR